VKYVKLVPKKYRENLVFPFRDVDFRGLTPMVYSLSGKLKKERQKQRDLNARLSKKQERRNGVRNCSYDKSPDIVEMEN